MDPANMLLVRDHSILPSTSFNKDPALLSIATHGVRIHQPPAFKGAGSAFEGQQGSDKPRGWALWEAGVMKRRKEEEMAAEELQAEEEEDEQIGAAGGRGKKIKRLTVEQVRVLEASFQVEKRLGPEKKQELALQLGLQPRQVAVWYQNHRARSKLKQLEMDHALLASHCKFLLAETHRLKAEVATLTKELENAKRGTNGVPPRLQKEDNVFKANPLKNVVLSVLAQDMDMLGGYSKECASTCSAYSAVIDCAESSTSLSHKDTNAYECSSGVKGLEFSCLSDAWNEGRLAAISSSYTSFLNPQDLAMDEPTFNIATADNWLWDSTT